MRSVFAPEAEGGQGGPERRAVSGPEQARSPPTWRAVGSRGSEHRQVRRQLLGGGAAGGAEYIQGTDQIHKHTEAKGTHVSCLRRAAINKKKEKSRMDPGSASEVSMGMHSFP